MLLPAAPGFAAVVQLAEPSAPWSCALDIVLSFDLGLRTQSWFVNVHPSCRLVMVIFLVWRSDVTYVLPYLRELTGTLKLFVV